MYRLESVPAKVSSSWRVPTSQSLTASCLRSVENSWSSIRPGRGHHFQQQGLHNRCIDHEQPILSGSCSALRFAGPETRETEIRENSRAGGTLLHCYCTDS
jgi:hypothetical protein